MTKMHTVYFEDSGLRIQAREGEKLIDIQRCLGLEVDTPCGGNGTCGKCVVEITVDGVTTTEKACAYGVMQDISVKALKTSEKSHKILTDGAHRAVEADPAFGSGNEFYIMAFDIGTTTLAGYLMSGKDGGVMASVSGMNPQAKYGADVIKRAEYAINGGAEEISLCIKNAVNELIEEAAAKAEISTDKIEAVTFAGNTCMNHLFLQLPVKQLVTAPYKPAVKESVIVSTADCGIEIASDGKLIWLPNIDGFVGSDTVAAMLAIEMDKAEGTVLMIDIGTNGEIALGSKSGCIACSTAAGPALEGANISCGMRGAEGAIEHMDIMGDDITVKVIGDKKALGICGSGLLDAVACLLKCGIIDETGRMAEPDDAYISEKLRSRIKDDGELRFVLAEDGGTEIAITQKDIREVQLAKAAITAGIKTALDSAEIGFEAVSQIVLAGAFGSYISPSALCAVGMIPPEFEHKIVRAGNAAGEGARLAAINRGEYERIVKLAADTKPLELASSQTFQEYFIDEIMFPEGN